jgi:hypothetical protein
MACILDPNTRYAICLQCPFFFTPTRQCKKCLCIMPIKVRVRKARCPVGKW